MPKRIVGIVVLLVCLVELQYLVVDRRLKANVQLLRSTLHEIQTSSTGDKAATEQSHHQNRHSNTVVTDVTPIMTTSLRRPHHSSQLQPSVGDSRKYLQMSTRIKLPSSITNSAIIG
jgi:hypothetical protein